MFWKIYILRNTFSNFRLSPYYFEIESCLKYHSLIDFKFLRPALCSFWTERSRFCNMLTYLHMQIIEKIFFPKMAEPFWQLKLLNASVQFEKKRQTLLNRNPPKCLKPWNSIYSIRTHDLHTGHSMASLQIFPW